MGRLQKNQQGHEFCLVAVYGEDHSQAITQHREEEDPEMILEGDNEDISSSSFIGSDLSSSSSSTSDLVDDASSTSSQANGALFDLSELMFHLPIKRGLSKFYQGKSQSFTSLERVTSLEDLAKKGANGGYGKRLKACKSYGSGLNLNSKQRSSYVTPPKATISKKSSSLYCLKGKINNNSFSMNNRCNGGKPPLSPMKS